MLELFAESPRSSEALKSCCANLYENEIVKFFLGSSFHPGGLQLTYRLAGRLGLKPGDRILDVACGLGASAVAVAEKLKVHVTGLDLSEKNCLVATESADKQGAGDRTSFVRGDAEKLPFETDSFGAVITECSFCTFPDKQAAAAEMFRVLSPGGRLGLSDVILDGQLPEKWQNPVSHILCLAGAESFEGYCEYLRRAGFIDFQTFDESEVLITLASEIKAKLMLAQIAVGLGKLKIPDFDLKKGNQNINEVVDFIRARKAGYGTIIATRP